VLDKAEYSAFESTFTLLSYRIVSMHLETCAKLFVIVLLCTTSTIFAERDNDIDPPTTTAGDRRTDGVTSSTADVVPGDKDYFMSARQNVVVICTITTMAGFAVTVFIAIVCKTRGPYLLH